MVICIFRGKTEIQEDGQEMRDCEHGQLARSCEICELKAENEHLKSGIQRERNEIIQIFRKTKFSHECLWNDAIDNIIKEIKERSK
jgi:hypothetical protein